MQKWNRASQKDRQTDEQIHKDMNEQQKEYIRKKRQEQ